MVELRKLINNDPLFKEVLNPDRVVYQGVETANEPDTFRVLLDNVDRLRFRKDVLGRLPTAPEIADYIKGEGD